jgi:hypothetical protein
MYCKFHLIFFRVERTSIESTILIEIALVRAICFWNFYMLFISFCAESTSGFDHLHESNMTTRLNLETFYVNGRGADLQQVMKICCKIHHGFINRH